jgi:hypothetical protein
MLTSRIYQSMMLSLGQIYHYHVNNDSHQETDTSQNTPPVIKETFPPIVLLKGKKT